MGNVRGKLWDKLTTRRALVVTVGLLFALAWAVPSIGASTAKLARKAFARANLAYYHADLAINSANTAKTTANNANTTANSAKAAAGQAQTTADQAQTTANTALSAANSALHRQDNFTMSFDPGSIAPNTCTSTPVSRVGVLATDEVLVTPPDTQPLGILVQASTSASQVTLAFCNVTGGAIDPPSGSYEFSTFR